MPIPAFAAFSPANTLAAIIMPNISSISFIGPSPFLISLKFMSAISFKALIINLSDIAIARIAIPAEKP